MKPILFSLSLTLASLPALAQQTAPAKPAPAPMTFFVTSVGIGDGANLGGLASADAHCRNSPPPPAPSSPTGKRI
jgi:hypothetical protein